MATLHDASCRCLDCRSRRAFRAAQGMRQPGYVPVTPVRTPEEIEQEELERRIREWEAFVHSVRNDPLAYVMASREEGVKFEDIAVVLADCAFDDHSIAVLIEEARSTLNATRLRRGLSRIVLGAVVAAASIGLTYGLASLFSEWIVVFWGLMLGGLGLMGHGVIVMFKVERSG